MHYTACMHSANTHIARTHERKSMPAAELGHQAYTCTHTIVHTYITCTHSADTHIAPCKHAHVHMCQHTHAGSGTWAPSTFSRAGMHMLIECPVMPWLGSPTHTRRTQATHVSLVPRNEQSLLWDLFFLPLPCCCSWAPRLGTRGGLCCVSSPTLESRASFHRYHSLLRAVYIHNLISVGVPEPGSFGTRLFSG
jgi:hypothetical protein